MNTKEGKSDKKSCIDWVIRPATIEDHARCTTLIEQSFTKLLPKDYSDDCLMKCLPLITTAQQSLLSCKTWYVVEHPTTGQMVGCGGWTIQSPSSERNNETSSGDPNRVEMRSSAPVPNLRHFAVHPDFTRQGIASLLWKRSYNDIRNTIQPFPTLMVYSTLTAESFYASCGFKSIRNVDIPLSKDARFPSILMERTPMNTD